jgi:hypothetical protein
MTLSSAEKLNAANLANPVDPEMYIFWRSACVMILRDLTPIYCLRYFLFIV